jgi:hypothetical protein
MKNNYSNEEMEEVTANLVKRLQSSTQVNQQLIVIIEALRAKFTLSTEEVENIARRFVEEKMREQTDRGEKNGSG